MTKHVFILGATGYIGGAVLARTKRTFPNWTFSALVRSDKNDAAVKAAGAEIVRGDHSSYDASIPLIPLNRVSDMSLKLIRAEATKAEIVLACADCDDVPLARAVLDGLAARVKEGKSQGILVHTSGTGVVSDNSEGAWTEYAKKIWNVRLAIRTQ